MQIIKIICCVCVLLSGCTSPIHVVLLNVTDDAITVHYKNEKMKSSSIVVLPEKRSSIKALFSASFYIEVAGEKLTFSVPYFDESYVSYDGFGPFLTRRVKVAFKERCLYLLNKNSDSFSVDVAESIQPEGFPLCASP